MKIENRLKLSAEQPNDPAKNSWFQATNRLIIGHRGASALAPENTLKAFRLAQEQAAHGIEFDVRLSADMHPMIIHDKTLERTTNKHGNIGDQTAAMLSTADAGEGEMIPTLSQLIELCGIDFLYNIEIKEYGQRGRQLIEVIGNLIKAHPAIASQLLISSFDHDILPAVRDYCPAHVAIGALRMDDKQLFPTWLYGQADHPHHTLVDEAYMQWAREHHLMVNVWTVDDPAEASRLASLGVNGIVTNKPSFIGTALQKHGNDTN